MNNMFKFLPILFSVAAITEHSEVQGVSVFHAKLDCTEIFENQVYERTTKTARENANEACLALGGKLGNLIGSWEIDYSCKNHGSYVGDLGSLKVEGKFDCKVSTLKNGPIPCRNEVICHDTLICQSSYPVTPSSHFYFLEYQKENKITVLDLLTGIKRAEKVISEDIIPIAGGIEKHVLVKDPLEKNDPYLSLRYGIEYKEHPYNGSTLHRTNSIKGSLKLFPSRPWNRPPTYELIECFSSYDLHKMTLMRPERVGGFQVVRSNRV